jgi:hypothetical protein
VFEPGRIYVRADVHREWGGTTELQRQGGIPPAEAPLIVVVTGEAGQEFGYADHWDGEAFFTISAPAKEGDMAFVRGNRALRDHAEDGEDVHLFEQERDGLRAGRASGDAGDEVTEGSPQRVAHRAPPWKGGTRRAPFKAVLPRSLRREVADDAPAVSARR